MKPSKVLLFDIDGTLIWSHGAGRGAIEAALKNEFGDDANVDGVPFHGRTDRAIVLDAFQQCGIADTQANRDRVLAAYLGLLPTFLVQRPGAILPGIEVLLNRLAQSNVALGLLTGNVRRGAAIKLGHYKLNDRFDFGGFGDLHIDRNDVAFEAMQSVRNRFGKVPANDIWVIGDTPKDVICGRHIGVRVLAVCTGGGTRAELEAENPDSILEDLSDADSVMAALELHPG